MSWNACVSFLFCNETVKENLMAQGEMAFVMQVYNKSSCLLFQIDT